MGKRTPLSEKGNRPICFLSVQGLAATNRSAQEVLERKTQTDFEKQGMGGGGEITSKKHPTKYPIKSSLSYCVVCKDKLAKTEAPFSRF